MSQNEAVKDEQLKNGQSLESLFSENQETIQVAKERKASEETQFSKVKYFTTSKGSSYKVRILPLPPSSQRRGYEYPLREITMKIKDPSTGKETYVGACKATEAGLSVDLIETYRKLALVKAKGDEDLTKKLKSGTFSGGIGYDSKRAMYIFDLNSENPKIGRASCRERVLRSV